MLRQSIHDLIVPTSGRGFTEVTWEVAACVRQVSLQTGIATLHLRHTSASLLIQENADSEVGRELEHSHRVRRTCPGHMAGHLRLGAPHRAPPPTARGASARRVSFGRRLRVVMRQRGSEVVRLTPKFSWTWHYLSSVEGEPWKHSSRRGESSERVFQQSLASWI